MCYYFLLCLKIVFYLFSFTKKWKFYVSQVDLLHGRLMENV